ncbi:hypothetical protein [Haloplanus salinus]|nr:hypothetical protein [Haloplanus salinus]
MPAQARIEHFGVDADATGRFHATYRTLAVATEWTVAEKRRG